MTVNAKIYNAAAALERLETMLALSFYNPLRDSYESKDLIACSQAIQFAFEELFQEGLITSTDFDEIKKISTQIPLGTPNAHSDLKRILLLSPDVNASFENIYDRETRVKRESYDLSRSTPIETIKIAPEIDLLRSISLGIQTQKASLVFDLDQTFVNPQPGVHEGFDPFHFEDKLLSTIFNNSGGALAIISGRPVTFALNAFPTASYFMAGEFGGHIVRVENGRIIDELHKCQTLKIDDVNRDLSRTFARHVQDLEGCSVETHKVSSVTVQCTDATSRLKAIQILSAFFKDIVEDPANINATDPMKIKISNAVDNCTVDLVPSSADKGVAKKLLRDLPNSPFKNRKPFVFGDSAADEPMMKVAKEQYGFSIWVGQKPCSEGFTPDVRIDNHTRVTAILKHALNL